MFSYQDLMEPLRLNSILLFPPPPQVTLTTLSRPSMDRARIPATSPWRSTPHYSPTLAGTRSTLSQRRSKTQRGILSFLNLCLGWLGFESAPNEPRMPFQKPSPSHRHLHAHRHHHLHPYQCGLLRRPGRGLHPGQRRRCSGESTSCE